MEAAFCVCLAAIICAVSDGTRGGGRGGSGHIATAREARAWGGLSQAVHRGCMMLRGGGGRRVRERDRIATGVDAKDVAGVGVEEEAWDGRALHRRIQELQQGGSIKLFIDGLYLPSTDVPHGGPHVSSAADIIHPYNRYVNLYVHVFLFTLCVCMALISILAWLTQKSVCSRPLFCSRSLNFLLFFSHSLACICSI